MSETGSASEVDVLVRSGRYEEAAALSAARGDRAGAIRLYCRVWNFAAAWPLAVELGDWPLAVRLALDARDAARALLLAESVPRDDHATRLACAEVLAARGHHAEAASLAESAAAYDQAVGYHKRARDLVGAGGAQERAGRPHEALADYQTAARTAGSAGEQARARLAEGRLLARLGHRREAIRALQSAAREPAWQLEAWRALLGPLADEGLSAATAELSARLRLADPHAALDAIPLVAAPAKALTEPARDDARFRILRDLGGGSAARVVMAEDRLLGRSVALKIVQSGGSTPTQQLALTAFHREAEAAARLRHPTIVALLDVDRAQGVFVLEWMAGGTLADRLAREARLSAAAVRRMTLDLLDALDVAHAHGIVHRDVKPANVFFDEAGNTKLGDFGSAHLMDFGQTQTGGLLGTVAYMAPEQITAGHASPATDLYAVGVLVFEALTGRLPFDGPDIVAAHLAETPRLLRSVRPQLSALHETTLARALAKEPTERFASAGEMRDQIRRWPEREEVLPGEPSEAAAASTLAELPAGLALSRVALGATPRGELHADLNHPIGLATWVEVVTPAPDSAAELAAWQALAGGGSPALQRVLDLGVDAREIAYEQLEGTPHPWPPPVLTPALIEAARNVERTRGEPPPFVYLTRGGWVVPCVWLCGGRAPTCTIAASAISSGTPS